MKIENEYSLDKVFSLFKENESYRLAAASLLFLIIGVFIGRCTTEDCIREVVCKEYIRDRDFLQKSLVEKEKKYVDNQKELAKSISDKLKSECQKDIDKALEDCEFSERIHCPICIARGVCKWSYFLLQLDILLEF